MELDEKIIAKASGIRSLSSSVQSTPDKNGHSDGASKSPELLPDSKTEQLRVCIEKERKTNSKCKQQTEQHRTKLLKITESKKSYFSSNNHHHRSKKQQRKGENPVRLSPSSELNSGCESWTCKNPACRAVLSMETAFCRRCSCCICHVFDDNKDPSLWLTCSSPENSCGLSCHVECALQREKAGVVNLGQLMQLDGNYCCASCGKVSGILEFWKKQLIMARDARRIDVICYRIFLSFRLLDGTSRFRELHEIVRDAKAKLETEVGPVNGVSAKMARGIVGRLSVAGDVQELCAIAIDRAGDVMWSEKSLPPACKFLFEEVTSSSVVILLIELQSEGWRKTKGYKLWYCRSRDDKYNDEPNSVFLKSQRRILISDLQPCTEYSFRIISCAEDGELGHSESKCFTKSVEIIHRKNSDGAVLKSPSSSSGFRVRELGTILRLALAQEEEQVKIPVIPPPPPPPPRGLDLNVVSVPDLNEPVDEIDRNRSRSGVDSDEKFAKKRTAPPSDCNSTLMDAASLVQICGDVGGGPGGLDENFEYCVKVIRWLECEGHVEQEFRLKLLTWFSLRSTEQERRVVFTFIQTLLDDPVSLARQLVHSFSDIVVSSHKRPRNGFCSKLWH